MKALRMSLGQDLKKMNKDKRHAAIERDKKAELHAKALELLTLYPQAGPSRNAMWAVARIGLAKCKEIAEKNLSAYHFRKAVAATT